MWNVLSAAKLIFINLSHCKLSLARPIGRSLARGALALGVVIVTASVALASPVVQTSGPNLGTASLGANEYQLTAIGGDGINYTWTLVPGFGTLPPGMSIRTDLPTWFSPSARAGLIGVATTPGTYHFRLRASSGSEFSDRDYTFTISTLVVKDQHQVFDAFVGEPYSYSLTAQRDGGDVAASWLATTGSYPPGLSLSPVGILQGTPTTPGVYDFSYSVSEGGHTVFKGIRVVVNPIHITTNELSNVLQNGSYLAVITATGGSNAFSFSANGLPPGLTLNSATGTIAGTVAGGPGVYQVNVTATDTVNHVLLQKSLAIDVIGVPPALPAIVPYGGTFQDWPVGQSNRGVGIQVRSGGRAPFTWVATGLPPGLSIRSAIGTTSQSIVPGDAEIWGNPTVSGNYPITFTVTDADGVTATNTFMLHVSPLQLTNYLVNGTLNSPYSSTLRIIGGTAPYAVTQIDGRLPLGLGLDSASQVVSGTPGENGNFSAQFHFNDADSNTLNLWNGFNIGGPTITINNGDTLPETRTGLLYTFQLSACCVASVNWSVLDPSTLPPGMGFSSSGLLSGTPSTFGTFAFVVKAADATNATNYALRQFKLTVTPMLVATGYTLPYGNVGSQYRGSPSGFALSVIGGTGPYTWTLYSGSYTPPGVTLSPSGVLSGVPTATGLYQFNVKVTDTAGHAAIGYFSLSIYPTGGAPPPGFSFNTNLGTWSIGQVDGQQLIGNGGNGTYTFTFEGGTLPPGLAIRTDVPSFFPAGSSGLIGVATTPGTYVFQLGVTSAGIKTVQTFTMKIVNLVVKNPSTQLNTYVGQPFSFQLIALRDGVPVPATWTATSTLPAGVSLTSSGELHGTPAAPGPQNVSFNFSDGLDTTFRNVNYAAFALQITTSGDVLPNAVAGAPYSTPALTTTGGSGSYTYSVSGNTGGLVLNAATGVLAGTVTNSTLFSYTITATDTLTGAQSDGKRFTVNVGGAVPVLPQITTFGNPVPNGTIGVPLSILFNVTTGGSAPFAWTAEGLPPGVDIRWGSGVASSNVNPTQVELWGTPVATGLFNIKLTVTDAFGVSSSQTFPLFISELMTTIGLPNGTIETPYSQTLRVIGGTPGYTAAQSGGILANGLSLNAATQTVAGTPHESGGFNVVLQFNDLASRTFQSQFFYTINSVLGKININTGGDLGSTLTNSLYSRQLSASLSACCASGITWSLFSGTLPSGITLTAGGLLAGTPTVSGVYTFVIRATDNLNAGWFAARQFTLNVTPLSLTTSTSLPFGNVGTPYSAALVVTGGTGAITWTVAPFNYLPPGLSLIATSGGGTSIAGTPTSPGFFGFTLNAVDGAGRTLSRSFTLSIYPAGGYPPLNWPVVPLNVGPVGVGIVTNIQLTGVSGGVPPYHYSYTPGAPVIPGMRVQDGQPLPTFFALSVGGGVIGVATTPGVYASSVRVTDSVGSTVDRPVVLTVSPLHILSQGTLPKATRTVPYAFTMEPFPAGGLYTWSATNMPPGLAIDAATGVISGTPTTAGQFIATLTLRDAASNSVSLNYTIIVNPYAITTNGVLANATQNVAYNQVLSAPGCAPCSWSVQAGSSLPSGLILTSASGIISGTPTTTTFTSFTVVASSGGNNVSKIFALRVVASTPQPLTINNGVSFGVQTIGNNVSLGLNATGGTGPYTWTLFSGTLPTGVRIDGPGDVFGGNLAPGFTYLIGRALQLGTFNFTLKVTDNTGAFVTKAFTYVVTPLAHSYISLPVTFTTPVNTVVTPLQYQTPYSQPLLVLGGSGTYTHTALGTLPTGLVLDPVTGVVSGTPINTGSFNVSIQASDTSGNVVVSNISFNVSGPTQTLLNFSSGPSLGISQLGTINGFNNNLGITGGTGPYTLTALTPLPPGFSFQSGNSIIGNNVAGTYVVSGTPLAPGNYAFTVEARDTLNNVGARTFTLAVAPFTIASNTSLPDASLGVPYSQTILTWDNVSTPTFTAASALPPGMSLTGNVISGMPTTAGTFNFSITVSDASGAFITFGNFSLRVSNMQITDPQVLPVVVTPSVPFTYTFTAVGGGGTKTWTAQNIPQGFSLSPTGTLTGSTGNNAGTFAITLTVNDGVVALQRRFTFYSRSTNRAQLDFSAFSALLPDATIGQSYINSPVPSGGTPPYAFSVAPGSALPPGLSLISTSTIGSPVPVAFFADGTILAGAPSAEGLYVFDLIITDAVGASVRRAFTLNVSSINILPGAPRTAFVGTAYAEQFTAVGGTGPYTFSMSPQNLTQDMLPPGFSLSPSGLVSGATNSTGNYAFVLRVQDSAGHSFSRTYASGTQLTVNNALRFLVTNTNNFDVKVGHGLFETTLLTNGNSSYTWSVAPGSSLPPGLFLLSGDPFLGTGQTELLGQPTTAGTFTYTLRAIDNANGSNVMDHTFTINVVPMHLVSPPLRFMGVFQLPSGEVGAPYSFTFKAAGGASPYSYVVSPFTPLPQGLMLSSDGVLSGTPASPGSYPLGLNISDAAGNVLHVPGGFTLVVTPAGVAAPLILNTTELDDASPGVPFSQALDTYVRGGRAPFTFSVTPGFSLPAGLKLLAGGNGVPNSLGGIATAPGQYEYWLTVMDAAGQTASGKFTQHVSTMSATPVKLPPGRVGTPYSAKFTPSGGAGTYTILPAPMFDLPAGLTLDATGLLSGIPTTAGDYAFLLVVFDGVDYLGQAHRITIDNAAGEAPAVTLPDARVVNYLQGAAGGASIPIAVSSTTGTQPFTALATGIPGASMSPDSGIATGIINLNLDAASLATGTYVGAVGVNAPASANANDFEPVVLNVRSFGSDTTPPVIGPVGDVTTEATSATGAVVMFATPSVTDDFHPAATISVSPPSGSLFPIGVTLVTATATDSSGNISQKTFNVTVVDTTKPALTLPTDISAQATSPAGAVVTFTATALDTVDGPVTPICVPASGATFSLGVTTVNCSATDAHGNASNGSFTVTVVDTVGSSIIVTSPVSGAGYVVGQPLTASYSCSDAVGAAACVGAADGVPADNGASIDTSTVGLHHFTVNATDVSGNPSNVSIPYNVIELPRIVVTSPLEPIYTLGSVALAQYTCVNAVTCVGDIANGAPLDTSTPGFRGFTINAADAYGNMAQQVVTYAVSLSACVMPFPNMTAWLMADGTVADEIGGNAVWTGTPAYGAGRVGQAFSFDGASHVSLPLAQTGSFTLGAWVATNIRFQPWPIGVLSTGGPADSAVSVQIEMDGTGNYQLNAGNGGLVLFIGPATAAFQHVALTYDSVTATLSTYLNGQLVDTGTWFGSPDLGVSTLILGADRSGQLTFAGAIDEAQVFNRALTASEVMQAFLTGGFGLCKDQAPVAVAGAPSPVEATGPDGAAVPLDGTASFDADGDPLIYTWREGSTTLGAGSTLLVQLSIGSHPITLTVDDGRHKNASANTTVVIQDTTAPRIDGAPRSITTEATGPAGAVVMWTTPTATDVVDGALAVSCTPASGSTFPIGTTPVGCSVVDSHGNPASVAFTVTAQDTTSPAIVISAPTNGAMFARYEYATASFVCTDTVGVSTCDGPAPSGAALDTSTKGPHVFTVSATDVSGNPNAASVAYTVVAPPTITVTSPAEPIYELQSTVLAQYSCEDAVTCAGEVANGDALDTSTPGLKYLTINATDALGNMTSAIVAYNVSYGATVSPIAGVTAWLAGDGSAADELSFNVGTWTGTPAYAAGKVAQAFSVGGGNTVSFPIVQPGAFTLQAWVKTPNPMQPYGSGVLSTGASGQQSTTAQIEFDGAGNYQLNAGNGDLVLFIGPATDNFHHVAVTFDGSMITTYFDGQPMLSDVWLGSPDLGVLALNVGVDRGGAKPFTGLLDEVQVFNRALSADEVEQTFLSGASGFAKDHAPVAVIALGSSNPAEAVGPIGAMMLFDGAESNDADHDSLTYSWREGTTPLGAGSSLLMLLPVGSHQITLTVDDGHFKTGSTDIIVIVRDTTPPVISGTPSDIVLEATAAGGAVAVWVTPTATDIVDEAVDVICLPASGDTFGVRLTMVTCTATDAHLNATHTTFNVTVNDTTPPVLDVPAGITVEATAPDGAVVSWTPAATDIVDGSVGVTCVPSTGSLFAIGTTHVECSATDAHGNPAAAGFEVVVRDTTPPALTAVPAILIVEATGPAGAMVTYASPAAADIVDGLVTTTCVPSTGTVFVPGNTIVTCSAADSRGNRAEASFTVRVVDTIGPVLTLPESVIAEATGPLGTPIFYSVSAIDIVSGVIPISCAPEAGSTFGIGVTAVTCSATDGAGNIAANEFPVVVRDTTPPAAQIVTPSADAMLTGSLVTVNVQASDIVGVAGLTVNGTPASLTTGSPQSGTWTASVPIAITPGTAIDLSAVVADAAGNIVEAARLVDDDGISSLAPAVGIAPFALDRGRTTGADLSSTFSSEFNNGITAGAVTRNGWTVTLNASAAPPRPLTVLPTAFWPTTGWVQVGVTGAAGPADAIVGACVGGVKQIRLNAPGERGVFACDPTTGTIAFRALSASPTIELWKQISPTTWLGIPVMTGGGVSTGSPTTAFPDNPGPIDVKVVRFDDNGVAHVVGTFRLAPGASADVVVRADAAGQDDQFEFRALHGTVPIAMGSVLKALEPGTAATLPIDRTPPRVACGRADGIWHGDNVRIACAAEDRELGLWSPTDAQFSLTTAVADGEETSAGETESRTVCDGGGNCAAAQAIGGNRIDRKPPTIDVMTPRAEAVYVLNQAVVGSFSCDDGGSGVASCAASSDNGQRLPTSAVGGSVFSVVAADHVGNSRSVSIPYAVTYAVELAEDGNAAVDGGTLPLAVRIADAGGANRSASSVRLRATGMVSVDGTTRVELTGNLPFDTRSGVYRLALKTGGLRPGTYRLQIEVDGDPVAHVVPVRVK